MHHLRRALSLAPRWTLAALLLAALAQCPPTTARAQEDDYQTLIQQAVGEFNAQRFEEARALFRRAHHVQPNARTLRGIGLSSFELRDYVTAYRSLTQALADARRPLDAEQRAATQEVLDRATLFVGVYRVTLVPEDARLTVDGQAVERAEDGTVVLALGRHELVATGEAGRVSRVLQVEGGEHRDLTLEVGAAAAAPPPDGEGAAPAPPSPSDTGPSGAGLALVASGAVLVAAGAVAAGTWVPSSRDEVDRCDAAMDRGDTCSNRDALVRARGSALGVTLSAGILGLGALTGGLLLVLHRDEAPEGAAVRCAPAGLGVSCAGVF